MARPGISSASVAFAYLGGLRGIPWHDVATAMVMVMVVAFSEETLFRGVVLGRAARLGLPTAVATSSSLFGLAHTSNLAVGAPVGVTLLQVVFSALAGTGYAAMRLRTASLWPPIVLHAGFDLAFRVAEIRSGTTFGNVVHLLHGYGWAIYAWLILRPLHPGQARVRRAGASAGSAAWGA